MSVSAGLIIMPKRAQRRSRVDVRASIIAISALAALALTYPGHPAFAGPKRGTCLRVANVEPLDFLYIREKPDHTSRKVGAIHPDTRKKIIVSGRCTPRTENKRKLWCLIDYNVLNNKTIRGYIKMYFAKEISC